MSIKETELRLREISQYNLFEGAVDSKNWLHKNVDI
jgi:hypothetical protein